MIGAANSIQNKNSQNIDVRNFDCKMPTHLTTTAALNCAKPSSPPSFCKKMLM
jgi:hypothetical protein